jgi:arylsulfatase A-like enzyme
VGNNSRRRRGSFGGVIKESALDSTPYWPPRIVPPKGAPNILLIMTDDQGYGVSGTFGGLIPTPALDRVAKAGLRYTQFHSTALCSTTRAALITGRNHHTVGFGVIGELSTGFPGYDQADSVAFRRDPAGPGYFVARPYQSLGGIRTQFHHVIDIVPTILEATGVRAPEEVNGIKQNPIEGVSKAYTFDPANANASSKRDTRYFEIVGNRAIYHDGWIAATTPRHRLGSWVQLRCPRLSTAINGSFTMSLRIIRSTTTSRRSSRKN